MAAYTFNCFAVFKFANEYDRKGIYFRQILFMLFVHFFGYLSLFCSYGELKYLRAYLITQLGILAIIFVYRGLYPLANKLIINNMCMLLSIGFIILTRLSYDKAMKQFFIALGSVAVTLIVPFLISRITFFEKFKYLYIGAGILSLLVVLVFSNVTYGSKLNLTIANYTFQPSEYVKILFVFAIASILATSHELKDVIISAIVAMAHVLLLVLSKDLGSAVIFFIVYLCMMLVATRNYLYFVIGLAAAGCGSVIGYMLFHHVRVRVMAFVDPLGTIENEGYQIAQSLFAIGTGGWLGMGIGQGAPNTIPVVAADFVFSAICEEFGVIFAMCLILICVSCFIMFMNISMRFNDKFFKLVALGLAVSYGFQVILTIGGVTKFIPLTGVTLPLVSYGGTSVAVTCCVFAVIQGLYIYRGRDFMKHKEQLNVERHLKRDMEASENNHRDYNIQPNSSEAAKPVDKEVGFGGTTFDTVMMDEAFAKAVQEGINASDDYDYMNSVLEDE